MDQGLVHHSEIVGDVEADEAFVGQHIAEFGVQALVVAFFHYENHVGPPQVAGRYADARARLGTSRAGLMPIVAGEDSLGGEAALLIAATDEKEFQGRIAKRNPAFADSLPCGAWPQSRRGRWPDG